MYAPMAQLRSSSANRERLEWLGDSVLQELVGRVFAFVTLDDSNAAAVAPYADRTSALLAAGKNLTIHLWRIGIVTANS
jgi:dsRNA-specific ribonuclease